MPCSLQRPSQRHPKEKALGSFRSQTSVLSAYKYSPQVAALPLRNFTCNPGTSERTQCDDSAGLRQRMWTLLQESRQVQALCHIWGIRPHPSPPAQWDCGKFHDLWAAQDLCLVPNPYLWNLSVNLQKCSVICIFKWADIVQVRTYNYFNTLVKGLNSTFISAWLNFSGLLLPPSVLQGSGGQLHLPL